jgi:hypothetical protein
MEENKKPEFRLYEYETGTLRKVGSGKTGMRPHIFETVEGCSAQVERLREKYKSYADTQFVIVEYTGPFRSRIVTII